MDGGTINNVNIQSAIDQCMEIVDHESKITLDVYICGDLSFKVDEETESGKTISNYMRNRSINGAYHGENRLTMDRDAHPDVNWRYMVYETVGHAGGLSELNFDGDKTWALQE